MRESNKNDDMEIDLIDLLKFVYKKKIVLVIGLIIGLAFGWGYSTWKGPIYSTSLKIQLPGYCNERIVNSISSAAGGSVIISSVAQKANIAEGKVVAVSKPERNAAVLDVTIEGKDPEEVEQFSQVYEKELLAKSNAFVKDSVISSSLLDPHNADVSVSSHVYDESTMISVNPKIEVVNRTPVILKKPARLIGVAAVVGLLLGGTVIFFQYVVKLYKEQQ